MKATQTAQLLILLAILCQLVGYSGWLSEQAATGTQLASLALLFFTLFALRTKKRKPRKKADGKRVLKEMEK